MAPTKRKVDAHVGTLETHPEVLSGEFTLVNNNDARLKNAKIKFSILVDTGEFFSGTAVPIILKFN